MRNEIPIFDSLQIARRYPINITSLDKHFFDVSLLGTAKPTSIKYFQNVTVNSELFIKGGLRFHIKMESFGDTWQNGKYNEPLYQAKSFVKNVLRRGKNYESILWCFDQFSTGGYFHWITEISPRLWVAMNYEDPKLPLLLPSYFRVKWRFASLFLETFKRPLFEFNSREVAHVDKMAFVTQTGGPFNYQPVSIKGSTKFLLDHHYSSDYTSPKNQRVYISRRNTGKRMLLNETQVEELLVRFGYKTYLLEEMSVADQINLFARASHVISIHGAGLSNMVFMSPGSTVIEIRHKENNHMLNCFFTLAHTFEHKYYYCLGYNKGFHLPNEIRPDDKSIYADVEMLKGILLQVHD